MNSRIIISIVAFALLGAGPAAAQTNWSSHPSDCHWNLNDAPDDVLSRLKGGMETPTKCSAALVTAKGRAGNAKAWALTAAHCIDVGKAFEKKIHMPEPGEIIHNLSIGRSLALETGKPDFKRVCINADKLLYATLTEADIALYELRETYDDIKTRTGVEPFVLSSDKDPSIGTSISVRSAAHRKVLSCTMEKKISAMKEAGWQWGPTARMSEGCNLSGGYSGSPVVGDDTGEVIGVAGTSYHGGDGCGLDNPCEMDEAGQTSVAEKGRSYFHYVHPIHACLDGNLNFDLNAPGCPLLKPQQ